MRREPDFSPPPVDLRQRDDVISTTLEYKFITPLFGGGVKPQQADPITRVRAASVVGHLRFWWRACRSAGYPTIAALRAAEEALWGSTEIPSQVVIDLRPIKRGSEAHPFSVIQNQRSGRPQLAPNNDVAPAYVAFPMQPPQNAMSVGMNTAAVVKDVAFELRLRYPRASAVDVEAALWAWETFGGIGGRTRRGFGALQRTKQDGKAVPLPQSKDVEARLQAGVKQHVLPTTQPNSIPVLDFEYLFTRRHVKVVQKPNAMQAWHHLVERYRSFRQQRNPGTANNRPGRSHWPEPDAIRRATGQSSALHSAPISMLDAFPRAVFGLPIIFHFKDMGDPQDTSLQGQEGIDRLASPLILRPLACSDGAVGLAAVLLAGRLPPGGIRLMGRGVNRTVSALPATPADLPKIRALTGGTPPKARYPFEAFLEYL